MSTRILYIDDETDLLELAAAFFGDEKLPLETCSDFKLALELVQANNYDLVISDANLPGGSGLEIFRYMNLLGKTSKKILVSGNIHDKKELQDLGCNDVLAKPIDFLALIDKIKTIL